MKLTGMSRAYEAYVMAYFVYRDGNMKIPFHDSNFEVTLKVNLSFLLFRTRHLLRANCFLQFLVAAILRNNWIVDLVQRKLGHENKKQPFFFRNTIVFSKFNWRILEKRGS